MWKGESIFERLFGLRGFKIFLLKLHDHEKRLRALERRPDIDWQKTLNWVDTKMEEHKEDDEGEEEV